MSWIAVGVFFVAGSLAGWWLPREAWEWTAASLAYEPWRLLSAALIHLSTLHLAVNVLGTVVVTAYGRLAGAGRREALAWLAAWPLTHLLLLVQPEIQRYAGLSGVLHAGVVIASLSLFKRSQGSARAVGAAVLLGLLGKLLLEDPVAQPLRQVTEWPFAVATWAHAAGALAGLLCGGVAWVTSRKGSEQTMS